MILYLVCDISGSMSENGKCLITRGLARSVEQYYRLGYGKGEIKLVAWGEKARIVEWILDDEYPSEMLDCKGSASAASLIELMGEQPDGKVLLITDGFYPLDDAKALKRWKDGLLQDTLRVIKVGADANPQLKGAGVFTPEDIFAILDKWTEGSVT